MNKIELKELIKGHKELAQIDDDLLEYIDFSKLIELNKRNYKDFHGMIEIEQDEVTRAKMKILYKQEMHADIEYLDFDNSYREKYLQWHGVDVILTKKNNGNKYYVQEKITRKRYDSLMFEYRKASGKAGWATDESELADILVYYQPNRVFIFRMKQIREYVIKKLNSGEYIDCSTDNENIIIPINELSDNVRMYEYDFIADDKKWKRK